MNYFTSKSRKGSTLAALALGALGYVSQRVDYTGRLFAQDAEKPVETIAITHEDVLSDKAGEKSVKYLKEKGVRIITYKSNVEEAAAKLRELRPKSILYLDDAEKFVIGSDLDRAEKAGDLNAVYRVLRGSNSVKVNFLARSIDPDPFPDARVYSLPIPPEKGARDWRTIDSVLRAGKVDIKTILCKGGEGILDLAVEGVGYAEARTNEDGKLNPEGKVRRLEKKDGKILTSRKDVGVPELLRLYNKAQALFWAGGHGNNGALSDGGDLYPALQGGWNYQDSDVFVFENSKLVASGVGESITIDSSKPKAVIFPASCQVTRIKNPDRALSLGFMKHASAVLVVGYPFSTFDGYAGFGLLDRVSYEQPNISDAIMENEIGLELLKGELSRARERLGIKGMTQREVKTHFYGGLQLAYGSPLNKLVVVKGPKVEKPIEKTVETKTLADGRTEYIFRLKVRDPEKLRRSPVWVVDKNFKNVKDVKTSTNIVRYGDEKPEEIAYRIGDNWVWLKTEKIVKEGLKDLVIEPIGVEKGAEFVLSFIAE